MSIYRKNYSKIKERSDQEIMTSLPKNSSLNDKGVQTFIDSNNMTSILQNFSIKEKFESLSSQDDCQNLDDDESFNIIGQNHPVLKNSYIISLNQDGIKKVIGDNNFSDYIIKPHKNVLEDKRPKYELIILVTAYNEEFQEFSKTLNGIHENLPETMDGQMIRILVVVIIDGIFPFSHTVMNKKIEKIENSNEDEILLESMEQYAGENKFSDFFDWENLKELVKYLRLYKKQTKSSFEKESKEEYGYLFCNTCSFQYPRKKAVDESTGFTTDHYSLLFCIKDQNKKKLNTHKWFLKGFCKVLQPKYIIFIDVGTIPLPNSLATLYTCLKENNSIAGCCGEIIPEKARCNNFIQQAQVIEYKFSHLFDKSFESLFGYVSVLPGAFSAYRFNCFTENLLDVYFHTETNKNLSLFQSNMYLAEDRILCLELMCQREKDNFLTYLPDARAETDVPDTLPKLMKQRRRWVNGSWFSLIFTIISWKNIYNSNHTTCRKFWFLILNIYYTVNAVFTWVLVGSLYLCMSIALKRNLGESNNDLNKLNKFSTPIVMFYVSTLIALFICSLSVSPEKITHFLNFVAAVYGVYTFGTFYLILNFLFQDNIVYNPEEWRSQISFLISISIIFVAFLVIFRYFKTAVVPIFKGIFQYFCISGAYTNIFLIYSICNIHDVSWGNRPDKNESDEKQIADYEGQRIIWVAIWIISNCVYAAFFNWTNGEDDKDANKFINYLAWINFFLIFTKVLGGFLFLFYYKWFYTFKRNKDSDRKVMQSNNESNRLTLA